MFTCDVIFPAPTQTDRLYVVSPEANDDDALRFFPLEIWKTEKIEILKTFIFFKIFEILKICMKSKEEKEDLEEIKDFEKVRPLNHFLTFFLVKIKKFSESSHLKWP